VGNISGIQVPVRLIPPPPVLVLTFITFFMRYRVGILCFCLEVIVAIENYIDYFIQPRDIKIRNLAFHLFINHNFGFLTPILRHYILLNGACRSYALSPVYEAPTRPIEEDAQANTIKAESDENDSKEVILPGVNLLFDGAELHPFDIGACLQARQPISLIAEAAAASASLAIK